MEALEAFAKTVVSFHDQVDFCLVYVEEAHPTDGWDIGSKYRISNHVDLDARLQAARTLRAEAEASGVRGLPLLVDAMGDAASSAFGAIPERLAILREGRVEWLGGRGPMEYSVPELHEALNKALGR